MTFVPSEIVTVESIGVVPLYLYVLFACVKKPRPMVILSEVSYNNTNINYDVRTANAGKRGGNGMFKLSS